MANIEINIKSNAPQVEKETTSLRQQVRDLRKEMESCAVGSEEYAKALQKLANATHEYREQQEMVKYSAADLGAVIENVQSVASGLTAGFSAVNAMMVLTGNESEALEKTMVKLQAAIALVQGMQGLEGLGKDLGKASKSIKAFVGTLGSAAGPLAVILGLVAAVGAALTYIANTGADKQVNRLTESFNGATEALAKMADELEYEVQLHEAAGQSASDSTAERIQNTEDIIAAYERLMKQEEEMKKYYSSDGFMGWLTGDNKARKKIDENVAAYKELINEQKNQLKQLEREKAKADARENRRKQQEAEREANAAKIKRKMESDAAIAAAKAEAAAIAKAQQDAIAQMRKEWQDYFDDLITQFRTTAGSISTVMSSMSGSNVNGPGLSISASSDIDAFLMIYGVSSDELKKKMKGSLLGLLYDTNNAILSSVADLDQKLAAQDELRKNASKVLSEEIVDQVLATQVTISDSYDEFGNLMMHSESTVPMWYSGALEAAQSIPETFKKQYDSLKQLYQEGIITEDEYRANLLNIEKQYQDTVTQMRNELNANETLSAEQKAAIIYELERKPLEFAQEVLGELKTIYDAHIAAWDSQFSVYKNNIDKYAAEAQAKYDDLVNANSTWSALYGRSLSDNKQAQSEWITGIDNQISELGKLIEAINAELSIEQYSNEEKLYLLQQLDEAQALYDAKQRERVQATAEFTAENFQKILQQTEEGFSSSANLIGSINEIFNARIEGLKQKAEDALAAGNEKAAKRYEKEARKEFETSKKLQKTEAILSGLAGIAQAIAGAMQLGPIAGPIIGAINAAAVAATTTAQIMAINNTRFDNGSGSSSTSVPDTSFTLTSPDAYQNVLADEVQTDLQANAKDNQRVYVLESDITSKQDNVKSAVTTSTF